MDNIPEYVGRMHGKREVDYHHPDLEPILDETYGILVYQEQIIRIAADMAGYAPGDADTIRKAVAKKKRALMDKHKAQFIDGSEGRGYPRETAEAVWGDIEFFARYGFNKAHAADYAVITCQTAFLKAHYPVEYMTATLSVERNNTDKVAQYLAETRRMGIAVTPPNINRSDLDFTIETEDDRPIIRYGLGAIKNAGTAAIELILDERSSKGQFEGLDELCERVDLRRVGKRALESMIKVGVYDAWGSRPRLLEALDRMMSYSGTTFDAAAAGQMSLFGSAHSGDGGLAVELLSPETSLPQVDQREVLNWEKELIGVYISEHPLSRYLELAPELASATTGDLDDMVNGRAVSILGLLTYLRTHVTKKGDSMAFGSLEDLQGTVELVFFPSVWKRVRSAVEVDQVYLVMGKVRSRNGDRAQIIVERIQNDLTVARPADIASDYGSQGPEAQDQRPPRPPSPPREPMKPVTNAVGHEQDRDTLSRPALENGVASGEGPVGSSPPGADVAPVTGSGAPPPPNFDPDDDALYRPAPRVSTSPPDPPAEIEHVATAHSNESRAEESSPAGNKNAPVASRTIVIRIRPDETWRQTCRQVVRLAGRYEGGDALRISVSGRTMAMEFPNMKTLFCPEFVEDVESLGAIDGVDIA
jgi:DNA polymerase-3 subunit alpha